VTADSLNLELLGERRQLSAEELDASVSPHTGRALRRVRLDFTVRGSKMNQRVIDELNGAARGNGGLRDSEGNSWVVVTHSHQYTAGDVNEMYRHDVEIRQCEELSADRLDFGGLSLAVDKYEEDASDGGITVQAIVRTALNEARELEDFLLADRDEVYFPVVRVGVSDEPIRMRLGKCLWERSDSEIRHLLTFVSEEGDSEDQQRGLLLLEPERSRLIEQSVTAKVHDPSLGRGVAQYRRT
jgi:hypothetical protein